ncbi:MAG: tripartite tricarboxylate transporter substrate-binding protein, partial [Pseudomonadota bacterium]
QALHDFVVADPIRDFAPVVHVGTAPLILVTHRSLPQTLKGLIAHAKANPGALNFGSAGTGAASHLAMEHFKSVAGVDIVHVPYTGSAPAVVALLSGEIQLSMFSAGSVLAHIRSGKIRALVQWSGVFAPAGTPREIIRKLNQKINQSLTRPDVKEQLSRVGVEPAGGTSEQFARFIRTEVVKWGKVIEGAGIKAD